MIEFIQVTTAVADGQEAERIAAALVERRLAGCVQILGPVQSLYRWQGQVQRAEEWLLQIKTAEHQFATLESVIRELHSYECPEIMATPITDGSMDYLRWLASNVDEPLRGSNAPG
jgi:periplasmic divalent cation tolerance protein